MNPYHSIKAFLQKKHPLVFIDKTSVFGSFHDKPLDIVLSPSFYWIRKEELPVKSAFAAKKLVPAIFEPILPEGNYSYYVTKKEGFFHLFAYDDAKIVSFLESIGIQSSQINAIYFAQNEIDSIEQPIQINRQMGMINNHGIWSIMPASYLQESVAIEDIMGTLKHPKEKIPIDIFKNFVLEEGQLHKIMAALMVLIVLYGIEHWSLRQEFKMASLTQFKIMDDYALPKTSMQLEGLKSELSKKEMAQENIRKEIKKLITLPLLEEEKLTELLVKKSAISCVITLKDTKRAEELKKNISQKSHVLSIKVVDLAMHVEVKL